MGCCGTGLQTHTASDKMKAGLIACDLSVAETLRRDKLAEKTRETIRQSNTGNSPVKLPPRKSKGEAGSQTIADGRRGGRRFGRARGILTTTEWRPTTDRGNWAFAWSVSE